MGRPLILVTPSPQDSGVELLDPSISVGNRYLDAVADAGGLPLVLPLTTDRSRLAEYVEAADGVMLTGGDDIDPRIYQPEIDPALLGLCDCAGPVRDTMELTLLDVLFRSPRPLLAICRGHQLVNVALGGTLYADLPSQRPGEIRHAQMDRRFETVHEVEVVPGTASAGFWKSARFGVNSTHHQAVHRLADPLQATLLAPDGVIEGTELRPEHRDLLPWYSSVQFHPERLAEGPPEPARFFAAFIKAVRSFRP